MENLSAKQLHEVGETLRSELPGVWAILRGRGSTLRIAQLLGWTEAKTERELTELSQLGIVVQRSNNLSWALNTHYSQHELWNKVRKLYQAIDRRLAQDNPTKVEMSELSSIVRAEMKEQLKAAQPQTSVPSESQMKMLMVIWGAFERAPFTPLALGKAQGYTQAGWSKRYLETLQKKGYVEQHANIGRSTGWRLTELGVEWATK